MYIKPYSDIFIKYLLGSEQNKHLLLSFINAVLTDSELPKIVSVEIKNPFNIKDFPIDRGSILDVKATDENNRQYDIEVQSTGDASYKYRVLYYWAKLYTSQLQQGDIYKKLKPTICINVLNFILFKEIEKVHTCFILKEHKTDHVLTDHAMIHFLELPKLDDHSFDSHLTRWLLFFKNEGLKEELMKTLIRDDNDIANAHDEYKRFTQDDKLRDAYNSRLRWQLDYNSDLADAREKAEKSGIEKGIEKGKTADLLNILEIRFGKLPIQLRENINSIHSLDKLDELIKIAIEENDIATLTNHINKIAKILD